MQLPHEIQQRIKDNANKFLVDKPFIDHGADVYEGYIDGATARKKEVRDE